MNEKEAWQAFYNLLEQEPADSNSNNKHNYANDRLCDVKDCKQLATMAILTNMTTFNDFISSLEISGIKEHMLKNNVKALCPIHHSKIKDLITEFVREGGLYSYE